MSVCEEDEELQSWGWTDLSSYSSGLLDSEKEQHIESFLQTGIMSRRSLRLDDSLLDRSLPHASASFSVGGAGWRSNRSLKSRRSQQLSSSCSESLLHTPRKQTGHSFLNSSLHSVASDASLLSSMLDESSIQETTLLDTLWGLDQDMDPKESTVVLADRTLIASDSCCPKHQLHTLSKVYCKDCDKLDRKYPSLSPPSSSSSMQPPGPDTSIIYSRKSRTGVLVSVWDRSAACVFSLLSLLYHHLMLCKHRDLTDVLQLCVDSSVLCVRRAAACCVCVLTHTWQACRGRALKLSQVVTQTDSRHRGRSSHCRVMSLKESTTSDKEETHPNGSLCDDCKEKQRSEKTDSVSSSSSSGSSVTLCLSGRMWSAAAFTVSSLYQLTLRAASLLWTLTANICAASVSAGRSAGNSAVSVCTWLSGRWRKMITSFPLNRQVFVFIVPLFLKTGQFPLRLLLLLLPLLLLFSVCWFAPAGLWWSLFPGVNVTEWRAVLPDAPVLSSIYSSMSPQSRPAEGAVEEPLYSRPTDAERGEEVLSRPDSHEDPAALEESVRFVCLEQSLTTLWELVEAGGRREEQRHREVMRLYTELQQLVPARSDGDERWLSDLMETQLEQLRTRVEEERRSREQTRQQDLLQQQSESTRLDELERQLHTLAERTQEVQSRQEVATTGSPFPQTFPAAVRPPPLRCCVFVSSSPGVGVDRHSHDALLAEVARLEASLEDVRRDVESLSACDGCREIDRIQQTVSAQVSSQVREEVRSLVYGNGLALRGGASADLPESLLQWLSQQYVSGADLQGALASLELSILQNISLQLERRGSDDTLRETVLNAAGAAVTEEDVNVIVTNALRLFSQDRTGLADYALESGGGSILSTRCSQTYETKAALLSLFGVPLWYFSQSPRVVIQPDVHPGNCWAFRGFVGFLVIRLSMGVVPTAFSLEHIPKALAPSGTLRSAPRDFSVYGLDDEVQERGKLLGTYTYDEDGESLQSFPVSEENEQAFQIIEVQVLSNWGHEEYTCLYRFRVHGTPPQTSDGDAAGSQSQ
ncbi:SUN domain-containing protein 1-like [Labrus mixtus]|uniref:SUN domain-containing protein 1-like n=1 Tax=Labrus mixtus TaxID=508554 RepID=UPI0029C07BAC|nr:SUN domain-containing protein 1-like [Labrus mixtus]